MRRVVAKAWKQAVAFTLAGAGGALGAQSLGTPTTLEFGEIVAGTTNGSLTLDPSTGAITSAVGVYPTTALATSASSIVATDKGGRTATVYTSVSSFTLSGTGGSFSTSTSPFRTNYTNDTFTFPGSQSQTVTLTFQVGGTISIPASQAAGDYTGSLPVFIRDDRGNNSGTVSIPVHIRVLASIAVSKTQDLDLGTVIPGSTAGSVTLNPTSGAQGTTGGVLYAASTGFPALFSVTGAPSHAFTITLGASTITLTGSAGSMNLALSSSLGGSSTLSGAGTATVGVGGTLSVGANQAEGNYTGTLTVTVAYP